MKRMISLMLCLLMLLSMTACGEEEKDTKKDRDDEKTVISTTESEETTATTAAPDASDEGENDLPDSQPAELWAPTLAVDSHYMQDEEAEIGVELADYSDGIMLPELDNATVDIMMSVTWSDLQSWNDESEPYAQYHATLMWRDVYETQRGDVQIVTITQNEMTDYLAAATASGNAPDIIPANYDLTYPNWNAAGLTANMEEYADWLGLDEDNPNAPGEKLYNQTLMENYFRWGGESHAAIVESTVDRNYIVYNATLFSLFGETTPLEHWQNGDWTWTQFVKTCEAMTTDDQKGFTGWGLFPYYAPYPMVKVHDNQTVALNINDAKYQTYIAEVNALYQDSEAARRDESLQSWSNTFPLGIDAMVMTTKAGFKRVVDRAMAMDGDDFGIAPVPAFDPTGETVGIPSASLWGYSIAKASDNPLAAAAYIRLESLVNRNIEAALDGQTWYDDTSNVTAEEQAMIQTIESDDEHICVDVCRGLGDFYLIVDSNIVPQIYFESNSRPVSAIFDAYEDMLQAEVDDFNASV